MEASDDKQGLSVASHGRPKNRCICSSTIRPSHIDFSMHVINEVARQRQSKRFACYAILFTWTAAQTLVPVISQHVAQSHPGPATCSYIVIEGAVVFRGPQRFVCGKSCLVTHCPRIMGTGGEGGVSIVCFSNCDAQSRKFEGVMWFGEF